MSLTIIIDSYKEAKMKSHKLVETLIKPCALEMVKAFLDGEAQKNLSGFICRTILSSVKLIRLTLIFLIKLCQTSKLLQSSS